MAESAQTIGVVAAGKQPELVKGLGLFDSTMIGGSVNDWFRDIHCFRGHRAASN